MTVVRAILRLFRSAVFLGWLSIALASTAVAASVWAFQLSTTVAVMTANAAATAAAHRKQLAKAAAKARLRRAIASVPIAGLGAVVYFEERDYQEWLRQNLQGNRQQYACEVAALSVEVIDEVLQDLPEAVRPDSETVLGLMPTCG